MAETNIGSRAASQQMYPAHNHSETGRNARSNASHSYGSASQQQNPASVSNQSARTGYQSNQRQEYEQGEYRGRDNRDRNYAGNRVDNAHHYGNNPPVQKQNSGYQTGSQDYGSRGNSASAHNANSSSRYNGPPTSHQGYNHRTPSSEPHSNKDLNNRPDQIQGKDTHQVGQSYPSDAKSQTNNRHNQPPYYSSNDNHASNASSHHQSHMQSYNKQSSVYGQQKEQISAHGHHSKEQGPSYSQSTGSRSAYGNQQDSREPGHPNMRQQYPNTNQQTASNQYAHHHENRAKEQPKRPAPSAPQIRDQGRDRPTDRHTDRPPQPNNAGQAREAMPPPAGSGPQAPPRSSSKGAVQKYNEPHLDQTHSSRAQHDTARSHTSAKQTDDFRYRSHPHATSDHDRTKTSTNEYQGHTNKAYENDEGRIHINNQISSNKDTVQYHAGGHGNDNRNQSKREEPTNKQMGPRHSQLEHSKKKYSSTTAINQPSYHTGEFQRDPLQNPYALPAGSPPNKYGSMSALHYQPNAGPVQPQARSGQHAQPDYHGTSARSDYQRSTSQPDYQGTSSQSGYHGTAAGGLPTYAQAGAMPQAKTYDELKTRSGSDQQGQSRTQNNTRSPQGQPLSNEGRRYERRAANNPSQGQPPRTTKRGRILSQHEQQRSPPGQPGTTSQAGYHGTASQGSSNPGAFNSAPPIRAQSVSDLHITLSPNPNPNSTNLHRPLSVPNISSAVQAQERRASTISQNGHANGGTGIWKSKSLLDLALTSEGSNLQRSKSLTSLVAANPNLVRTASTYALYEMQVEKGLIPRDHQQTLVLSIVALVLFFPLGIPLVYFTVKNKPRWQKCLQDAITINNRLFWGAIGTIVLGALFWMTLILILSLRHG